MRIVYEYRYEKVDLYGDGGGTVDGLWRWQYGDDAEASTVNVTMVYTYFEVGRYIIEDEQGGNTRAEYGKGVLKRVSDHLTSNLGKGWSVDTLEKARRFFLAFSKSATPQRFLAVGEKSATVQRKFVLSWNHYQILSHVDNPDARNFYEIEAFEQQWSTRYLQRQIGSGLYELLARFVV